MDDILQLFDSVPPDIDLAAFDAQRVPDHIAVIMDGNGRWAQKRGKRRASGHKAGIKGVRELIQTCNDLGIRHLTIFSFSTENWLRPRQEVETLMALFANTMAEELDGLHREHVRIKTIGDLSILPDKTRKVFERARAHTQDNAGMTLVIAVNYGSRLEIVSAAKRIAMTALEGQLDRSSIESLTPEAFSRYLETDGLPDPDLLIRTSGEYRLSNFLLFQIAYSELYITPVLWPDFDKYELLRAILVYQSRQRRFGGV